MWDYICPRCKKAVSKKSHTCPHCAENYGVPLRVPPRVLKDPKALEAYVHKHVFPKVSSKMRLYLTRFFTVLFSDGFDSGDFSEWDGVVGSPTVQGTVKHHGSYAMSVDMAQANQYPFKLFTASANVFARFYWRVKNLPDLNQERLLIVLYDSGWNMKLFLGYLNDGGTYKWEMYGGTSSTYYTHTITADTWYCLEVEYDANADEHNFYLDGNFVATNTDARTENVDRFAIGSIASGGWSSADSTAFFDCVVVADAYIGPEATATLQTVTDALALSDAAYRDKHLVAVADSSLLSDTIVRNKTLLPISDSVGVADSSQTDKTLKIADSFGLVEALLRGKAFALVDFAGLTDAILRDKFLAVADMAALTEAILRNKTFSVADSAGMSDVVLTGKNIVTADAVNFADSIIVNKVFQVTETIQLVETVQVGVVGAKKTRLFLLIGDLAVQLTGE